MLLLIALPFYILGTVIWNFFILLVIFMLLFFSYKKYLIQKYPHSIIAKTLVVLVIWVIVNLIPLPLPSHPFDPEIGEYIEPNSIVIGWPGVIVKYYLGEGDLCPACVTKKPIHTGSIRTRSGAAAINLIALIISIPIGLAYLKNPNKPITYTSSA